MDDGKVPDHFPITKSIQPLMPVIYKTATDLGTLSTFNRSIHLPTYNKLIQEATLEAAAAVGL